MAEGSGFPALIETATRSISSRLPAISFQSAGSAKSELMRRLNRMFFKLITGGYGQEIRRGNESLLLFAPRSPPAISSPCLPAIHVLDHLRRQFIDRNLHCRQLQPGDLRVYFFRQQMDCSFELAFIFD